MLLETTEITEIIKVSKQLNPSVFSDLQSEISSITERIEKLLTRRRGAMNSLTLAMLKSRVIVHFSAIETTVISFIKNVDPVIKNDILTKVSGIINNKLSSLS
jgi:hypothetical protein